MVKLTDSDWVGGWVGRSEGVCSLSTVTLKETSVSSTTRDDSSATEYSISTEKNINIFVYKKIPCKHDSKHTRNYI